jgi:hypothetical protein
LQRVLYSHRAVLRQAGLLYPGAHAADQFLASVDLREPAEAKFEHMETDGAWARIVDEVRAFDANVVISHETFARSSRRNIEQIVAAFDDADLRIVLTARDLGRQIPAVWQEGLKNWSTVSFDQFLGDVFLNHDRRAHKYFWRPQDIARLVRRWGSQVGMDKVTVVTVPPSGAPRDELWRRFAQAIDLPDVPIDLPADAANTSLGPAEAELLRYVNASLPDDFPWPRYIKTVKRQFAESRLAGRESSRIVVPPQWHDALQQRSTEMSASLEQSGVTVVGDLRDLTPALPVSDVSGPDDLSRDELMQAAAEVVRDLLVTSSGRGRGQQRTLPLGSTADGLRTRMHTVRDRLRRGASGAG